MKRYLFFIVSFLLMILPINAKAYGIENYYINATIESDGDLLVEEYFNVTGEYNGFERIIYYENEDAYTFDPNSSVYGGSNLHNGDGLEILEVKAVPLVSEVDFDNIDGKLFSKVTNASKGDYGVYTENYLTNGRSVLIYNPSSYNNAFYIKYRISNIAIKHNDVGELGWNIFSDEFTESIGKLRVYINIPNNTSVKGWAHGPLNGVINVVSPDVLAVSIDNLSARRAIDVRTTFDLNVIKDSRKVSNVEALPKILLYEEDMANKANYEREQQDKININNAETALSQFEINPTRYYYENASSKINEVYDEEVKEKFLERLKIAKAELDKIEEETARSEIESAYKYLTYYNYNQALEAISILDNTEVRNELEKELDKILTLLKEAELKQELNNFIIGFIILGIVLGLGYYAYILFRKDPKTNFNHKYFRDIPSDLSPESVSYLFSKKITNNAMSASMIELVRKKIISVEKIKNKNYKLTNNSTVNDNLSSSEKKLLELIFHGRDTIETDEMEKYAKKNYDAYISDWKDYHNVSERVAKNYNYFESDINDRKREESINLNSAFVFICVIGIIIIPFIALPVLIIYILFMIARKIFRNIVHGVFDARKIYFTISFVLTILISIYYFFKIVIMQFFYKFSAWVFVLIIFASIVSITIVYSKKRRTLEGAEEYNKWLALKNFLNDFGRFQDKEAISVVLWEKYLVFATLFGCAETILKYMKLAMPDDPNGYVSTYTDLYIVNRYISSSVISSYSTARSAYTAAHSSSDSGGSFSSGGGGGGGFSSGGGSFGGGGGGGRF